VTHEQLWRLSRAAGLPISTFAPAMYDPPPIPSEYCLIWQPSTATNGRECAHPYSITPPNFVRDPLRSVYPQSELGDLYRVIAAGISGTAMPTWKGALAEPDLWALVYYVRSLAALRGTAAAMVLSARLHEPENLRWAPPH
jgi:hypothetical protein